MGETQSVITLEEIQTILLGKIESGGCHNTLGERDYAGDLGYGTVETLYLAIKGKRILDATAGMGIFGQKVNRNQSLKETGTRVVSVDPVTPFLGELLAQKGLILPLGWKQFITDTTKRDHSVAAWTDEGLPFPKASFDLIFDRNGFLLFYEPRSRFVKNAFTEMKRVLRPGGEVRTAMAGGAVDLKEDFEPVFSSLGFSATPIFDYQDQEEPLVQGFILKP